MTITSLEARLETTTVDVALVDLFAPPPVDITPSGHLETLAWRAVRGATSARVTSSTVEVVPTRRGTRDLGVVAAGKRGVRRFVVESPAPGALIRGLLIPDLVRHDGEERFPVVNRDELAGFRLCLRPIVGGEKLAPIITVPPLPARKALPAQLVGGSLSGSFFALPDVAGTTFEVTLVRGDAPEDFDAQTISFGDVRLHAAPGPVGLHADGPDGTELFALAGAVATPIGIDVTAAVQRHLARAVRSPDPVATLTLRSDVAGSASVTWSTDGVVERSIRERPSTELTGSTSTILVPPPTPDRRATRTLADVTIVHHGMALHPISDALPTADAGLGGPIVGQSVVTRTLPSQALREQSIAQVGVMGWARAETDLTLEVLGRTATVTSLTVPTARDQAVLVWFVFDEPILVERTVKIGLHATRGAFGWIADPDPLIRVAVTAAPAGETVEVGGRAIRLTGDETVERGVLLSGTDGWSVATEQFCTVSISNAVMEFAP